MINSSSYERNTYHNVPSNGLFHSERTLASGRLDKNTSDMLARTISAMNTDIDRDFEVNGMKVEDSIQDGKLSGRRITAFVLDNGNSLTISIYKSETEFKITALDRDERQIWLIRKDEHLGDKWRATSGSGMNTDNVVLNAIRADSIVSTAIAKLAPIGPAPKLTAG